MLQDIELTKSEESDPDEDSVRGEGPSKEKQSNQGAAGQTGGKLDFLAALNASTSHELEPLSMLELSDDATFHHAPSRHQRIPPYELWSPSSSHLHLLSQPLLFPEAPRGWNAAAGSPASGGARTLRDSSFWRRRLDRHAFGEMTTFL